MENSKKIQFIYPGDKHSFEYWSAILGVSPKELNSAIITTGSVDADVLARHFAKGRPFFYIGMFLKATWISLKQRFSTTTKPQYS